MKSRRYRLTIDVVTWRTLADLRKTNSILFCNCVLARSESDESRIVKVTVQPVRKSYKLPKAKGMVSVSVRPSSMEPVHTGNRLPKAKRAKGAK